MQLLSSQVRALSLILLDLIRNRTSSTSLQCSQRKTPARNLVITPPLRSFERGLWPSAMHAWRTLRKWDDISFP